MLSGAFIDKVGDKGICQRQKRQMKWTVWKIVSGEQLRFTFSVFEFVMSNRVEKNCLFFFFQSLHALII